MPYFFHHDATILERFRGRGDAEFTIWFHAHLLHNTGVEKSCKRVVHACSVIEPNPADTGLMFAFTEETDGNSMFKTGVGLYLGIKLIKSKEEFLPVKPYFCLFNKTSIADFRQVAPRDKQVGRV